MSADPAQFLQVPMEVMVDEQASTKLLDAIANGSVNCGVVASRLGGYDGREELVAGDAEVVTM